MISTSDGIDAVFAYDQKIEMIQIPRDRPEGNAIEVRPELIIDEVNVADIAIDVDVTTPLVAFRSDSHLVVMRRGDDGWHQLASVEDASLWDSAPVAIRGNVVGFLYRSTSGGIRYLGAPTWTAEDVGPSKTVSAGSWGVPMVTLVQGGELRIASRTGGSTWWTSGVLATCVSEAALAPDGEEVAFVRRPSSAPGCESADGVYVRRGPWSDPAPSRQAFPHAPAGHGVAMETGSSVVLVPEAIAFEDDHGRWWRLPAPVQGGPVTSGWGWWPLVLTNWGLVGVDNLIQPAIDPPYDGRDQNCDGED
jgi:hypothetical protein